jgi:hypothetical protein
MITKNHQEKTNHEQNQKHQQHLTNDRCIRTEIEELIGKKQDSNTTQACKENIRGYLAIEIES